MTIKNKSKRYCNRVAVAIVAGLLLTACSGEPAEPLAPGQAEYQKYCSSCHGKSGEGRSRSFPPLQGSEWLELGPDAVALVVLRGLRGKIEVAGTTYRGYMPTMRQAGDAEIAALLGYISGAWAQWPGVPNAARIGQLRAGVGGAGPFESRAELERQLEQSAP
ncbi:MAG: cytochrome c [Wenzhouxiangellaceae bacterium]|nr:cytochrome c [Wenzhouxiangellaceae bacterium]